MSIWTEIFKITGKKRRTGEGITGTKVARMFTRKELGDHPVLAAKITDPLATGDFGVNLIGREGRLYSLKQWLDQLETSLKQSADAIVDNNYALGTKLKSNLEYNISLRNKARKEITKLETAFVNEGTTVDKALKKGEGIVLRGDPVTGGAPVIPGGEVPGITGIRGSVEDLVKSGRALKDHIAKLKKAAQELQETASPEIQFKKMLDDFVKSEKTMAKLNHEGYYRSMVQPFLRKMHKEGKINLHPDTLKSFDTGGHHKFNNLKYPDPVEVYKYHFGDQNLTKIAMGNMDESRSGILKFIDETGAPKVAKKEGFENQGSYLSRADIERGMKESKDRYGWAKNKEPNSVYANISDAESKAYMKEYDTLFGKYEKLHDQLEIPERAGKNITEGMGSPSAVYKSYDDKGVISSLSKRITDESGKSRQLHYEPSTGRILSEDMPYATTRDLTKTEKVFKPEEIQKMKNELLKKESIQPPFGKQYETKLLDELGGEQLAQLIKREKDFKKKWTVADEADLVKRKKGVTEQTLLQDVEKLIEGTDAPIYSLEGKLTKAGKENATKSIHEIDDVLNELLQGDKFDFLGKRKEGLITRLQDKSVEIQERLKKSGVKLPEEIKSRGTIYKDITGETKGIALGWSKEDLKLLDKAMHKGIMESEAMKKAGLDTSKASDFYKWEKMKEEWLKRKKTSKKVDLGAQKVIEGVKKDRPSIRLMKNFEKELTDIDLTKEGYNLQEIDILKRAQKVMKEEGQNPDDALAWVRSEMADKAGVELEDFMPDFDWGDFPGKSDLAQGGRVGFKNGGIANQNMIATLFE